MGLLDCVSDRSDKYPVSPPEQAPMTRGMSQRRSKGIFASSTRIKGNDIDYWRHRLLCFLFKTEGREDVRELRMPLRQLGYNTIGDCIRDIPSEIYEPYQIQITPDTGLRKDYKIIWERDGVAEPGILKWEGPIEGQRCMGLQLDRKKAVPFGLYDGKGLFYCKPGHRALVPVDEVFPYKEFLRQFIGSPARKDSMPLNLLPGRSSVRVAVAKKYKPGDRVHLPAEGKWATILWTGRIDGEWVVDLVYDPEKPATGRMASPDEPCMSRSLSMAEFIDEIEPPMSPSAATPPSHVPPPPPKSPELEDDVFVMPTPINKSDGLQPLSKAPGTSGSISSSEVEHSASEDEESQSESDHLHSIADPGVESTSESEDEKQPERPVSEPGPNISKAEDAAQELKRLDMFEQQPLKSRPTHKPLFNLASFGRKKKEKNLDKPKPMERTKLASPSSSQGSPKRELSFFPKKSKNASPKHQKFIDQEIVIKPLEQNASDDLRYTNKQSPQNSKQKPEGERSSFSRRDRSRSPVHRKSDREGRWSKGEHREVPVDVPQSLRSPKNSEKEGTKPSSPHKKGSLDPSDSTISTVAKSPKAVQTTVVSVERKSQEAEKYRSSSSEESSDGEQSTNKNAQRLVSVEINQPPEDKIRKPSEDSSDSSPPYSPAIKDVGINITNTSAKKIDKKPNKSNPFKAFGGMFSAKKRTLPLKDYEESKPEPPVRTHSLEKHDNSEDNTSQFSEDYAPKTNDSSTKPKRKSSDGGKGQVGFFGKKSKTPNPTISTAEIVKPSEPHYTPALTPQDQLGDQEGLILDSLEVKDDQPAWNSPSPQAAEVPKRRGSKGKPFSFGFSKKPKANQLETNAGSQSGVPTTGVITEPANDSQEVEESESTEQSESVSYPEPKPKRNSFRESFSRTFSLTRDKRKHSLEKHESLGDFRPARETTPLYLDNNEVIGATRISKPKSKSASVLVDIQPWNERRGNKSDLYEVYDSPDEEYIPSPKSPTSPSTTFPKEIPAALLPKGLESTIPKHRMFTTPRSFFGFGQKASEQEGSAKPKKKTSFKGSKLPKFTKPISTASKDINIAPAVVQPPALPRSPRTPPPQPPPPVPQSPINDETNTPSAKVRQLKSAMKQRKEIDSIPKGVKIGDRVIWYNGRIPIPGTVMKLYKDGTDKYTAVVKFDRVATAEPLSLVREGDAYFVTVEELLTPEILGITIPVGSVSSQTSVVEVEPVASEPEPLDLETSDDIKSPTVRFVPSTNPTVVPGINVQLASPLTSQHDDDTPLDDDDDSVPPPFQEEEVELACGLRRGLPSRDRTSCIETMLFSMFYTNNTFDTSILFDSGFDKDKVTKEIRALLRRQIVNPLRQSGSCELDAVQQFYDLMQQSSLDFKQDFLSIDAEIMTFILFERALKLGKFISYSNGVTDYLHQLVLDPRDISKSDTLQHLFEKSLEQMDNSKLRTVPTPALIIEIPRANDKLVHKLEAVIPNLTLPISHLLENGPRLCICGMVAKFECQRCTEKFGEKALVYCDNCSSMSNQIHFQLGHETSLIQIAQLNFSMDLVAVICIKGGHYTSFVKCGVNPTSPWLFYDGAEMDNPKVSLEQNLGMWIDRLEKYPGKYQEAFVHPLLTHFLANSHICIYQPREKSSLV